MLSNQINLLFIVGFIYLAANCVRCKADQSEPFDHHRVDHEAFLGADESKQFDHLSVDESKKKLAEIAEKIDKDKDGFVTLKELESWIQKSQKNFIERDVEKNWKIHNPSNLEKLSWDEYRTVTYSFLDNLDNGIGDEDLTKYKTMEKKDKRRWMLADEDQDNHLSYQEFANFLHPERNERMSEVILDETLEDIDLDGDGKISIKEYISDMYHDDPKHEPDWVEFERKQFVDVRDKNKDGYLDREEVRSWLLPPNVHSEAEHLIEISDKNKDRKLSKQEILDNYDNFVGSEVTDYGQALITHDEF